MDSHALNHYTYGRSRELLKEMRSNADEAKSNSQEGVLKWMYKGPSDLIDREEYLLGKAIDKRFEELNSGGDSDLTGRTGEQSNVPKRLLEKTDNTEQVDIAKKILEDPLYAIKQKEMEARKKLLNNPVKLKQIRQILLERSKENNAHRKHKKKKLEEKLNLLIIKKLKKFSDKEKRKALNKIMKPESESSSSSSTDYYKKKRKSHRKRSSSSDSSSSSSESSSTENEKKNVKHKKKRKKIEKRKRKNSSSSDGSDRETEKKKNSKKPKKVRRSNDSEKDSSVDRGSKKDKKGRLERRDLGNMKRSRERGKPGRRDVLEDGKKKRDYGLMMPGGRKPEMKNRSPVRRYEKKVETKTKYVPPPQTKPLSEKEREKKLKEMMKDAKLRKKDREKNLASHRKKELLEEESKAYDDDFVRRQMKHLTSQGTMADRIKSNINNIQRSKSSIDNFMKR